MSLQLDVKRNLYVTTYCMSNLSLLDVPELSMCSMMCNTNSSCISALYDRKQEVCHLFDILHTYNVDSNSSCILLQNFCSGVSSKVSNFFTSWHLQSYCCNILTHMYVMRGTSMIILWYKQYVVLTYISLYKFDFSSHWSADYLQ